MRKAIDSNDRTREQSYTEPKLLTEKEVSALTGIQLSTLRHWRCKRIGPPFLKLGRRRQSAVRYALGDVMQWAERWRVETREEVEHGSRG
jgi:predicted DNA-binding transcriptional regulator AlpA